MTKMNSNEQGAAGTSSSTTTTSTCTTTSSGYRRHGRIALGVLALLVVAAIITIPVYVATRPDTVPLIETDALETLPSLIKVAPIGENGAIEIEYTELLEDDATVFYYLSEENLNSTAFQGVVTDPDKLALYLTHSVEPTIEDISTKYEAQRNLRRKLSVSDTVLRIGLLNSVDFPFRLPESFLPGDFNGAILVEETGDESVDIVEVSRASFTVIVDPEKNIGSSSPSTRNPTQQLTNSPTPVPRNPTGVISPPAPTNNPIDRPTAEPRVPPTTAPISDSSLLPPILKSELEGSYGTGGTITIDYVKGFENGKVVDLAKLQFDIPNLVDAPGPYLYLSKRPYSETKGRDLEDEDLFVPIDSGSEDGLFNVKGRFDQFLDEIETVQDLDDYSNGSWIVWCGPFGVYIGGGEISAS